MSLELRIIKDPCRQVFKPRTRAFGLHGGVIGRAPDSYWVLPDPKGYVSSRHCTVEFIEGSFWLRDNSRNGVYVNGSRQAIGRGNLVPLQHGDRLRVAEYELLVRVMDRPEIGDVDQAPLNGSAPDLALARLAATSTGEHAGFDPGHTTVLDTGAIQRLVLNEGEAAVDGERGQASIHHPVNDFAGTTHPALDLSAESNESAESAESAESRTQAVRPSESDLEVPGAQTHFGKARTFVSSALDRIGQAGSRRTPREQKLASGSRSGTSAAIASQGAQMPVFQSAAIDVATMGRWGIVPGLDDDRVTRAYKILRTRVRRRMLAQQWRSLGVTGTAEGVGKTVTALNLAITMGRDPASPTVLVDLDLYRPKVAMYLGMEFRKGIAEYLLGEASVEEILYSPGLPGLCVVPNGRPLRDGSELLASPRMTELVKYLESLQPTHTVIYDLPPLMMSDDVLVFSPHMDCVLDVVAVGVTPRASLQHSQEILSELNVVGVVLNRATEQDHMHSYYY